MLLVSSIINYTKKTLRPHGLGDFFLGEFFYSPFFSQFVMQVLQAARHLNCHCQILQAASFQRNISILICASFISHKFTFFLQKLLQNMIESFFHTYYAEKQKKAEKYCIHSREEVQCHQLMHIIVLEKRYIDGYHRKYRRR